MDVPEPPKIVFELPAPCSDVAQAEATLQKALAPSVAPHAEWTVAVRFTRAGAHLTAAAEITDDVDAPVAHRDMNDDSRECAALARAVGVWASLVLDAEMERSQRAPQAAASAPPPAVATWPAPAVREKPQPEAPLFLVHAEGERTVEIGATSLLMGGTGAGILIGPSVFAVFEVGKGWFLRPTVAIARTLQDVAPSTGIGGTLAAARFDACGRLPGFYLEKNGIQLDMCGGAEVGFTHFDSPTAAPGTPEAASVAAIAAGRTLPFLAVGPSLGLRGELGGNLSAMVRGVAEINLLRDGLTDSSGAGVSPSVFVGRAEVGVSWRLQ